jgi:hypothetical protein
MNVASIGFRRAATYPAARRQVFRQARVPCDHTARELLERGGNHPNAQQRAKLETTAAEWPRLAEEADRNDRLMFNFELPTSLKTNA